MEEIANRLERSRQAGHSECHGDKLRSSPHGLTLPEHIEAEAYAIENGVWYDDVSSFGDIGPCGDENYCYINQEGTVITKINMLTHTGESILKVFKKIHLHNTFFPDTRYDFVGFTNMGFANSAFPIFSQIFIANVKNANYEQIAEYMIRLGFQSNKDKKGAWLKGDVVVWDLLPKNVLCDDDGNIYVVDAEFSITSK